jgi:hypothetical protein
VLSEHCLITGWTEQGAAGSRLRVGSISPAVSIALDSGELDRRLLPAVLGSQ